MAPTVINVFFLTKRIFGDGVYSGTIFDLDTQILALVLTPESLVMIGVFKKEVQR